MSSFVPGASAPDRGSKAPILLILNAPPPLAAAGASPPVLPLPSLRVAEILDPRDRAAGAAPARRGSESAPPVGASTTAPLASPVALAPAGFPQGAMAHHPGYHVPAPPYVPTYGAPYYGQPHVTGHPYFLGQPAYDYQRSPVGHYENGPYQAPYYAPQYAPQYQPAPQYGPSGQKSRRFRRRFYQINRKYGCLWPGCTKSYGSLNHLNTHIVTKKHGQRKSKADFDGHKKRHLDPELADDHAEGTRAERRALAVSQSEGETSPVALVARVASAAPPVIPSVQHLPKPEVRHRSPSPGLPGLLLPRPHFALQYHLGSLTSGSAVLEPVTVSGSASASSLGPQGPETK